MNDQFDCQPNLKGKTISIRALKPDDFDGIYACGSDKNIWAEHPNTDRYKKEVFIQWFEAAIKAPSIVIVDSANDKIIGSSRYYTVQSQADDIVIGYTFLACEYWGGQTNKELKQLMLDHAFTYFDTVWFDIAASNIRSQKAILKIGAIFSHKETSDFLGGKEPWLRYKIDKSLWK